MNAVLGGDYRWQRDSRVFETTSYLQLTDRRLADRDGRRPC